MGELTDDLVDGASCDLCGQYFDGGKCDKEGEFLLYSHGYPATCYECWADLTKAERKFHQRALVKLLN